MRRDRKRDGLTERRSAHLPSGPRMIGLHIRWGVQSILVRKIFTLRGCVAVKSGILLSYLHKMIAIVLQV